MKDIQDAIENLAKRVAEKAAAEDTPFSESLDAFGKLTTYYGLVLRNQGKIPDQDAEPALQDLLNADSDQEEIPNGRSRRRAPVPTRTRAGTA